MKPVTIFLISSIITFCVICPTGAESISIVAVNYPPYTFKNKANGKVQGIYYDLIKSAFKAVDIDTNVTVEPLKRARYSFAKRKNSILIGTTTLIESLGDASNGVNMVQQGHINITFSYFKSHHSDKTIIWDTLTDLKPYKIGVLLGSPTTDKYNTLGLRIDTAPTLKSGIRKLHRKRYQLFEGIALANRYMAKKLYPDSMDDYAETAPVLSCDKQGLIYWKDDKKAVRKLARYLRGWDQIKKDGTFLKIQQKYWGTPVPDNILESFNHP